MPDNFSEFSKEIAKGFLQTVVVVDDRAFFPDLPSPVSSDSIIAPGFSDENDSTEISQADIKTPPEANLEIDADEDSSGFEDLNAKEIIDQFAKDGIFCSVIVPLGDLQKEAEKIRNLATGCDIIVFDWHLGKDTGEFIKGLIGEISAASVLKSKRNRLIAIYTGDGDLDAVYKDILEEVGKLGIGVSEDKANFVITARFLKIGIFAKKDSVAKPYQHREVSVRDLPDRLISEFTEISSGLVSNVVLKSFSAIRENTHFILSKFGKELDAAYLSHKAMLKEPIHSVELLELLIGDELKSLLEFDEVGKVAESNEGYDSIKGWLDSKPFISEHFKDIGQGVDQDEILNLIKTGIPNMEPNVLSNEFGLTKKPHQKKLTSKFIGKNVTNVDAIADQADYDFAILTSLKTSDLTGCPKLTFGSLLKSDEAVANEIHSRYWICVQPVCDCERLKSETAFPLVPLSIINDNSAFQLIVKDQEDYRKLSLNLSPKNLRMENFNPVQGEHAILAILEDGKAVYNSSANSLKYIWLGELKFSHIQRIVNQFAGQFSRVGLDESEWLRSWSNNK